jgi:hypothetical protein
MTRIHLLEIRQQIFFQKQQKPDPGHKEKITTVSKCIVGLGLTEAGSKISGDIYWKELRAPISRQEFMGMLAYY